MEKLKKVGGRPKKAPEKEAILTVKFYGREAELLENFRDSCFQRGLNFSNLVREELNPLLESINAKQSN